MEENMEDPNKRPNSRRVDSLYVSKIPSPNNEEILRLGETVVHQRKDFDPEEEIDQKLNSDPQPKEEIEHRSNSDPQPKEEIDHRPKSDPELRGGKMEKQTGSGAEDPPASRAVRLVADLRQLLTLKQHYYPEGGWGWVVLVCGVIIHILSQGFLSSGGYFYLEILKRFGLGVKEPTGWLGAMSTGVALLISPVTIAFCRRKSTRVTAVMGGLITALGCLFTSFATQFHQLFFR
ncbi:hypothetical protein JTB14_025553 [Gonioctena quinquepunctata]|nr:hypothetical protein JTB14_025553 [Gonioctena quinquepunctata]